MRCTRYSARTTNVGQQISQTKLYLYPSFSKSHCQDKIMLFRDGSLTTDVLWKRWGSQFSHNRCAWCSFQKITRNIKTFQCFQFCHCCHHAWPGECVQCVWCNCTSRQNQSLKKNSFNLKCLVSWSVCWSAVSLFEGEGQWEDWIHISHSDWGPNKIWEAHKSMYFKI